MNGTPSLWWDVAKAFLMLLLVLPLAYVATRLYAARGGAKRARYVRVVDMAPLGGGRFLCVVACGGRLFLLGVTAHQVTLLAELAASDEAEDGRTPDPAGRSFAGTLARRLARERPERGEEGR